MRRVSMLFGLGVWELVIVLVIVILIFGANKIPKLGKSLGEGIRYFKASIKSIHDDTEEKSKDGEKQKD
jgi:sec-independent protein translocase protein TatA